MKYKVGDYVKFKEEGLCDYDVIGKIAWTDKVDWYLVELPKELHGKGHNGDPYDVGYCFDGNKHWYVIDKNIICKILDVDNKESDTMSKVTKGLDGVLVQDVFRAVTDKKTGMIGFNPLKMSHLTFVKFYGNDKVYMFNNPTDKRLKSGTKVLVDSAGKDSVAIVVSSIKIPTKYVGALQMAMGVRAGTKIKNVLGVYETEVKKVETLKEFN